MIERPLAIARDHPAFDGHFPGRQVLPTVVLLAETLATIERDTATRSHDWSVSQVKFVQAVPPGADLTLAYELTPGGRARFEVRDASGLVAHGTLAAATA